MWAWTGKGIAAMALQNENQPAVVRLPDELS